MKIYTKTGDNGQTSLFKGGRVFKDHLRIEAYGTVDELNSLLGVASTEIKDKELSKVLSKIQNDLFILGADLATAEDEEDEKSSSFIRTSDPMIDQLELFIDLFDKKIPELKNFILPGGTKAASLLHLARTVCRRAERHAVKLFHIETAENNVIIYLNRLSDLLFVLSRYENFINDTPDIIWQK